MPKKGENIYKRRDGRWEGRYIKSHDINNRAVYGYVYARTYYDVKAKINELKMNTEDNPCTPTDDASVEEMCCLWLDDIKDRIKDSTYVKYFNLINNHIIPILGIRQCTDITTSALKAFVDFKLTNGRLDGRGGLSPKTVRDMVSVLKLIFRFAENNGVQCRCRFDNVAIKSKNNSISVMTKKEMERFTDYLIQDIDNTKLGILLCLYTGLRIGEICALKFEDIHDGIIHINKTMQRIQSFSGEDERKTKIVIASPKSSSSVRDIPIPAFLSKMIRQFYVPNAYVLTGTTRYTEPRTLENRFKAHIKKCGIRKINFHACRHTFASVCVEAGVEIKSLSEILGHASVNITLNRYVHSSMSQKRKNLNKLREIFLHKPSKFQSV